MRAPTRPSRSRPSPPAFASISARRAGASARRAALYLAPTVALLAPPPKRAEGALAEKIRAILGARGAIFFADLARETNTFPGDVLSALYELVWSGEVTNDTLAPLRSRL